MAELLVSTGVECMPPDRYRHLYALFLEEYCYPAVERLIISQSGPLEHHSLFVRFPDLIHFDSTLAHFTVNYPQQLLPVFDEALIQFQSTVLAHPDFKKKQEQQRQSLLNKFFGSVKVHAHVRILSLPPIAEFSKSTINDVNSDNISSLIQISGTIVRTGGVRMLDLSKQYECQNPKCRYRFTVFADPEQNHMMPQPRSCPRPANPNGATSFLTKSCPSTMLHEVEGSRVCVDYQEIKLQDKIDRLSKLGSVPRSIIVILEADLVDKFNPGDDVVIVGTIVRQWRPVIRGARCEIDLAIKANCISSLYSSEKVKVTSDDSAYIFTNYWKSCGKERLFAGRNNIIKSICPQLFGMFYVKLCLLLSLVGGSMPKRQDSGMKRRYHSHLLLIGDPGCGKSQLLRFAASTHRRAVITTGIGTTGAGLTCSLAKDGKDWTIEAGALVLANDGLCCIDEFASIREADRATIHEAMEQQTLSVAKAGLVVTLNTRATVIACCNPKGTYDINLDISTNTAIASPLLSRFDLVLILLDIPNKEWDKQVSTFLLQQALDSKGAPVPVSITTTSDGNGHDFDANSAAVYKSSQVSTLQRNALDIGEGPWDVQILSQYIAYVKHTFQPVITAPAKQLLMRYYQLQRQSDDRSNARTTVRLLESLMRLSEAHAKVMFSDEVRLCDAVVAIFCSSLSQTQHAIHDNTETLQTGFPSDPEEHYRLLEAKVFRMLCISKETFLEQLKDESESFDRGGPDDGPVANDDSKLRKPLAFEELSFQREIFDPLSAANIDNIETSHSNVGSDLNDKTRKRMRPPTVILENNNESMSSEYPDKVSSSKIVSMLHDSEPISSEFTESIPRRNISNIITRSEIPTAATIATHDAVGYDSQIGIDGHYPLTANDPTDIWGELEVESALPPIQQTFNNKPTINTQASVASTSIPNLHSLSGATSAFAYLDEDDDW